MLLALVPPAIGVPIVLPPAPATMPPAPEADEEQLLREALRLRGRWLQELTARAAMALGRRLYEGGPAVGDRRGARADVRRAAGAGAT